MSFDDWFQSQRRVAYYEVYDFLKAAWNAGQEAQDAEIAELITYAKQLREALDTSLETNWDSVDDIINSIGLGSE